MRFNRKFGFIADFKHLLGLLCHHQHQIEVVCSQRVFVEVIDINEEEKVLESFFSADRSSTFRRLHWTTKAHRHKLWNISSSEVQLVSSPRSSWTFCRAISNSGTVFFTWAVSMDRKYLERTKKLSFHVPSNLYLLTRDFLFKTTRSVLRCRLQQHKHTSLALKYISCRHCVDIIDRPFLIELAVCTDLFWSNVSMVILKASQTTSTFLGPATGWVWTVLPSGRGYMLLVVSSSLNTKSKGISTS